MQPADHPPNHRLAIRYRISPVPAGADHPAVGGVHLHQLGLDEAILRPPGRRRHLDAPAGRRATPGRVLQVVDHDLGGCAGTTTQCGDAVAHPAELAVDPPAELDDSTAVQFDGAEAPEAAFVAGEGHVRSRRRGDEGPLSEPPAGSRVLERFVDQRPVSHPQVEPSRVVAHTDSCTVVQEVGLLHAVQRLHLRRCRVVEARLDQTSAIPRHVGHVPRLPDGPRRARHHRRVEAEVGAAVVEARARTVMEIE